MKQRALFVIVCGVLMALQACVIQRTIRTSGQAADAPVFETPPDASATAAAATAQVTATAPQSPPPPPTPAPTTTVGLTVPAPMPMPTAPTQVDTSRWLGRPGAAPQPVVNPQPTPQFPGGSVTMYPSTVTAYDWYAVKLINRSGSIACLRAATNGYGVPMLRRRAGARHEQTWIFSQEVPGLPCPEAVPSGGVVNLATEGGQKIVRLVVEFYSSTVPPQFEMRREFNYQFPYEFPIVNDPCTQAGRRCLYVTELE